MARQRTDTESVLKLVIDGKQAQISVKELRDTYQKLNTEVNNLRESDNPQLYRQKVQELQRVRQAWESVRKEINGTGKDVNSFKAQITDLAKSAVGGLGVAGIAYGLVNGVKTMVAKNAELSDSYGRVMKTTGLTEEAVDRLNEKFKKLDTRTANAELLGLAEVAGKLGISAEKDVEGFVRAADKIGVALGEDLGGVEESINSLGKLTDIFKVKDQFGIEDALIKVGSAINTLGASGTANEQNLVDFTNRMAGIAPAANISLPAVLGLAAVQDELGQSMEASSTAIGQFIVGMGEDIPKFAKVAKMSVGEFAKLLKTDANEALLRVLEGSKSAGGGVEALAKNMKAIDVQGARGIAALGAMAENIDLVRQRQQESKEAFDEGTSVLDEFNTMNTNLAANLDKIGNKLENLWQNSTIREGLTALTGWLIDTRSDVDKLTQAFDDQKKAVKDLETNVNPLLKRYDDLKSKGQLSKEEQQELHTIIQQIAQYIPTAVSQWDSFGQAMDINREKVNAFAAAQRELLQIKNKDAIQDLQDLYKSATNMSKIMSDRANQAQRDVQSGNISVMSKIFGFDEKDIKTSTRVAKEQSQAAYESLIRLSQEFGVKLNGDQEKFLYTYRVKNNLLDDSSNKVGKSTNTSTPTSSNSSGGKADKATVKAAEKARKTAESELQKATDAYEKLMDSTAEFGADQLAQQLSQNEKEIAQENKKYADKIKAWEDFKLKKGATDDQLLMADGQIALLEAQQSEAVASLRLKHEQETTRKIEELRAGLSARHGSELEKEKARIHKFYDELERDNAGNEAVLAQLKTDRAQDIANAVIREEERVKSETERLRKETIDFESDKYANRIAKIKSTYAIELDELYAKYDEELQATEAFEQAKAALQAKYDAQERQVEIEQEREIRDLKIGMAEIVADTVFTLMKNSRDAELQETLSRLDKQRESELSNKNLTEEQKKGINAKYDRLQKAEKLKAWKAEQKAAMLQAIINTALAVTKALPNPVAAAIAGAAGAAQVAIIAAQKPPVFAKGGFIPRGPRHAQGGLNIVDSNNRAVANIEGGEPIISRQTYANNREIVDALLYSGQRMQGASIGLNPDLLQPSVYSGAMSTAPAPIVQVQTNPMDNGALVDAIGRLVDDKINKIQVELPFHLLEDRQKKVVSIRNSVDS